VGGDAMMFEEFVNRIRHLRRDRSGGKPKPHKPLLFASVVVLIHKGEIRTREVFLDGGLESVFHQLVRTLYPLPAVPNTAPISSPTVRRSDAR
jgi:hypothetical protein